MLTSCADPTLMAVRAGARNRIVQSQTTRSVHAALIDRVGGVAANEMLGTGDGSSGAYVALEKVSGTLHGRSGSFVLVHRALMVDGAPQEWTVAVECPAPAAVNWPDWPAR